MFKFDDLLDGFMGCLFFFFLYDEDYYDYQSYSFFGNFIIFTIVICCVIQVSIDYGYRIINATSDEDELKILNKYDNDRVDDDDDDGDDDIVDDGDGDDD